MKEMQIKTMRKHFILVRSPKSRMLKNPGVDRDVGHRDIFVDVYSYIYPREESGSFWLIKYTYILRPHTSTSEYMFQRNSHTGSERNKYKGDLQSTAVVLGS